MRILLKISYHGAPFYGWQTQIDGQTSVQSTLQDVFSKRFNQPITLFGGSRTDRGVHAHGQLATADVPDLPSTLLFELNKMLRPHIALHWIEPVADDFKLHHEVKSKVYHYYLYTDRKYLPFLNETALYLTDKDILSRVLPGHLHVFEGTHDFKNFANKGSNVNSTKRTLYKISFRKWHQLYIFRFHGSGFLKQMVRNLMGTLLGAAQKNISPNALHDLLESDKRSPSIITAPAQGLHLIRSIL
jgi:tRNA pseudouridine38-40 synthase